MLAGSCVSKFIPEVNEANEMLVVEGMITDQPGINTVRLSRSVPLDERNAIKPLKKCVVTITDDAGNSYSLTEKTDGTYVTDSTEFRGVVGRKYQLRIKANDQNFSTDTYVSFPMEMKPVPPIDSVYYEKVTLKMRETGCLRKKAARSISIHMTLRVNVNSTGGPFLKPGRLTCLTPPRKMFAGHPKIRPQSR